MKDYEGDYEFEQAERFGGAHDRLTWSNPEYGEIGRTFTASMRRVSHLAWLPVELCYWSGLFEYAACAARHQLGLNPQDHSKDKTPEFHSLLQLIVAQYSPSRQADNPYLHVAKIGVPRIKEILRSEIENNGPKYRTSGIEAVLAAMITAAYAAFETMAADLWIAAVNRSPDLAKRFSEKHPDRQIPLNVLAGYGFDASKSMGRILAENRRVSFISFNEIRNAYRDVYRDDLGSIFSDVKAVMEAEKVRHLIAHRDGIVDEKFHKEMQEYPDYKDVPVGTSIPFNGPLACRHIKTCSVFGAALFVAVDSWAQRT